MQGSRIYIVLRVPLFGDLGKGREEKEQERSH